MLQSISWRLDHRTSPPFPTLQWFISIYISPPPHHLLTTHMTDHASPRRDGTSVTLYFIGLCNFSTRLQTSRVTIWKTGFHSYRCSGAGVVCHMTRPTISRWSCEQMWGGGGRMDIIIAKLVGLIHTKQDCSHWNSLILRESFSFVHQKMLLDKRNSKIKYNILSKFLYWYPVRLS